MGNGKGKDSEKLEQLIARPRESQEALRQVDRKAKRLEVILDSERRRRIRWSGRETSRG